MSKPVSPEILRLLEPYLDLKEREWLSQPKNDRHPTLPTTPDGIKINVRELVKQLGCNPHWEQHFYRKSDLSGVVNALARLQGIQGIGSRSSEDDAEAPVKALLAHQSTDNKRLAEHLVEAQGTIIRQQQEIAHLRAQLGLIQESGVYLRTGPVKVQ